MLLIQWMHVDILPEMRAQGKMIPGHFQDRLKTHTGLPTLGLPELLPGSVWLVSSLINQGQGLPRLETKVSNSFEFTFLSWASPLAAYRFRHAACSAS